MIDITINAPAYSYEQQERLNFFMRNVNCEITEPIKFSQSTFINIIVLYFLR